MRAIRGECGLVEVFPTDLACFAPDMTLEDKGFAIFDAMERAVWERNGALSAPDNFRDCAARAAAWFGERG